MKYLYLFAIVAFLFASCKTAKQDRGSKAGNISSIWVERTPCFGFCPMYEVQISADGTATLDARDHLPNKLKGKFIGKVPQADWENLVKLLHTLDYQNLKETYGNRNVSDLPSVNIAIRYGKEQEKKVNDYGGRGTPELTQFYEHIDKLVTDVKWDVAK
ncbi:DUF6438 domain-containing protein [Sphingobacterium paludis]|uniref:DUF6438 domain-containing protein n=1 Tax=Sphingobacterium paludis TaxID=1476465 RepID=A0A4R7D8R5_9SPHI|nr:DUF6438 domain-containing protein [Sphingobacterium paludis]TDS16204.1 hypothetical protein B0I21_102530 [Sphingobacterium paludis]